MSWWCGDRCRSKGSRSFAAVQDNGRRGSRNIRDWIGSSSPWGYWHCCSDQCFLPSQRTKDRENSAGPKLANPIRNIIKNLVRPTTSQLVNLQVPAYAMNFDQSHDPHDPWYVSDTRHQPFKPVRLRSAPSSDRQQHGDVKDRLESLKRIPTRILKDSRKGNAWRHSSRSLRAAGTLLKILKNASIKCAH